MEPIPLPSRIHYELLLQILERQTMMAIKPGSPHYEQVQGLIVTLRKALSQQKQLEEFLQRSNLAVDYRWASNLKPGESISAQALGSQPPPPAT